VLPNPPRDTRSFKTDIGRGRFTVSPLEYLTPPSGHLVLQTIRSHDQYNTTFYGLDDRYRGISEGRRVILVHPEDLAEQGFKDRDLVDVVSTFQGADRRAEKFRLVAYPTAKGCAAAYFPEANVLVHKENVARVSNTPWLQGHVRPFRAACRRGSGCRGRCPGAGRSQLTHPAQEWPRFLSEAGPFCCARWHLTAVLDVGTAVKCHLGGVRVSRGGAPCRGRTAARR
jgi:hypothetical protein